MRQWIAAAGIGMLGATVAPLSGQDAAFEWTGALERGEELEVQGIAGDIRVVLARGDRAEVTATKHGRRGDFEDVEIVAVETRDGVKVCAVYFPRGRAEDRCLGRRDRDGHWDGDIDVRVDFEIALPAGVELVANTVSGEIDAESLRSDVRANTVSGDVRVSTSGVVRAHTVNGEIDVELGSSDWDDLEFATVSGDITVALPASIDTEVFFSSLSGDFDSEFEMRRTRGGDRWVGTELEGVIGDGRRSLEFKTVSGDVRLLRTR